MGRGIRVDPDRCVVVQRYRHIAASGIDASGVFSGVIATDLNRSVAIQHDLRSCTVGVNAGCVDDIFADTNLAVTVQRHDIVNARCPDTGSRSGIFGIRNIYAACAIERNGAFTSGKLDAEGIACSDINIDLRAAIHLNGGLIARVLVNASRGVVAAAKGSHIDGRRTVQ